MSWQFIARKLAALADATSPGGATGSGGADGASGGAPDGSGGTTTDDGSGYPPWPTVAARAAIPTWPDYAEHAGHHPGGPPWAEGDPPADILEQLGHPAFPT